jgi:hypothetical protein
VKPIWKITLILFLGLMIGGAFWGYTLFFKKTKAGLLVDTTPKARVFIDGREMGKTKYDITLDAREITLKLVPISAIELSPYETKIKLVPGVKTVYQRNFTAIAQDASDVLISYKKTGLDKAAISVITSPQGAELLIDNKVKEKTPIKLNDLKEGEHELVLASKGYQEKKLFVKSKKGYELIIACTLGRDGAVPEPTLTPTPTVSPAPVTYVSILDTPTGFLRVRKEPSTLGTEVGQVSPGKLYELLAKDEKTGWFQIRFEGGNGVISEGWVSSKYAVLSTPTPSPQP